MLRYQQTHIRQFSITKSTTTGRVTATSNAGTVTAAILSPADTAYMVTIIRLHYIPNGVINLSIPYIIEPYPLVSDYDQPVIDAAVAIELGATMMTWRYKRQFSKRLSMKTIRTPLTQ